MGKKEICGLVKKQKKKETDMKKVFLKLAVLFFVIGILSGCVDSTIVVKVKPDGSGTIEETVGATGSVAADRWAILAFKSSGPIAEVMVQEGEKVRGDQVLARVTELTAQDFFVVLSQGGRMLQAVRKVVQAKRSARVRHGAGVGMVHLDEVAALAEVG